MTRDEAIQKALDVHASTGSHAQYLVDVLIILGLLKLTKPQTAEDLFFSDMCRRVGPSTAQMFDDTLKQMNLKIVEK